MTTDRISVPELLAAALQGAADVARARLERDVQVVAGQPFASTAILRFDLSFARGGRLTWFVSNEDATGLSDMLIGGPGDRGAVLTEMHLDALTVAFSDMLSRAVDGIAASLSDELESGDLDLGMEQELHSVEPGGAELVLALEIDGFGPLTVVQHADAIFTSYLDRHALSRSEAPAAGIPAPPAAAPAPAAEPVAVAAAAHAASPAFDQAAAAFADPATVGNVAAAPPLGQFDAPEPPPLPAGPTANVVALPGMSAGVAPVQPRTPQNAADLDLLMNVPLPLTVELGQTQRTIRELLEFSVGSIIELSKLAGDPLDIKVNDRVIARGEVVVIDEEFGIRVTEIVSPQERLHGLA